MREAKASARLTNAVGLHARPSVKFAQTARRFHARIEVSRDVEGPWTDAKSTVKILRIKAIRGEVLHLKANGADADTAVATLIELVRRNFDEE